MGTHPIFESDFDCLTDWAKMTKGTTSRGTRNDKTHILCRINGRRTYHIQKKKSSTRVDSIGLPRQKDGLLQALAAVDISKMSTADFTMDSAKVPWLRKCQTKLENDHFLFKQILTRRKNAFLYFCHK